MKMKYDESDNTLIRASRAVTEKMTDILGNHGNPLPPPHNVLAWIHAFHYLLVRVAV